MSGRYSDEFDFAEQRDAASLSALNHLVFCERRCALIHVEGLFEENVYTLEGRFAHERADTPGYETLAGVRAVRALPLFSHRLGLVGKADIVEFWKDESEKERPYPVDYKRGKRRKWDNDEVQLCAQGLCLEEMYGRRTPRGAIYYAASRRRREVAFDQALRQQTEKAIEQLHQLLAEQRIPVAAWKPKCDGCSLKSSCLPQLFGREAELLEASQRLFVVD